MKLDVITHIFKGYSKHQIFNCNETGLPGNTLTLAFHNINKIDKKIQYFILIRPKASLIYKQKLAA